MIVGLAWALACHHRRRGIAGVYHLDQSVVLVLRDGQVPGILYPDPVNSVLAPVGSIFRFPIFGSSSALGTVRAGRDGDEMLRIIEVVCVLLLSIGRPIPGAAAVGVLQRDHVVDVKFAGVGDERCWCRASATRLRRRDTSCRSGKQWSLGFELPRLRCGSPGSHHRRRSSASSRGGRTRGCWPGSWITFREGRSVPTYREQLQELSRGPYVLLSTHAGVAVFAKLQGRLVAHCLARPIGPPDDIAHSGVLTELRSHSCRPNGDARATRFVREGFWRNPPLVTQRLARRGAWH